MALLCLQLLSTKGKIIMIEDVYEMRSSSPAFHMLACISPSWELRQPVVTRQDGTGRVNQPISNNKGKTGGVLLLALICVALRAQVWGL